MIRLIKSVVFFRLLSVQNHFAKIVRISTNYFTFECAVKHLDKSLHIVTVEETFRLK